MEKKYPQKKTIWRSNYIGKKICKKVIPQRKNNKKGEITQRKDYTKRRN